MLAKRLVEHGTGYDKPFGTPAFRRSVVEDYWGLDAASGWGPSNVIACQGGRDALAKAYDAVQFLGHGRRGDFVVVSRVPFLESGGTQPLRNENESSTKHVPEALMKSKPSSLLS